MMIAAANDSAMVIDSSYSFSIGGPLYGKIEVSYVIVIISS